MASDAWIDKYELARRFGLINAQGKPKVWTINVKAKSGEWESHLVNGQLRFSPEDVAAIEEKIRHPATVERQQPARPPPVEKATNDEKRKRKKTASRQRTTATGWDLEPRPIRDRNTQAR